LRDKNKERTLSNFPMQANGSDMLRIAIINAVEDGIKVLAPVHDALLIEANSEDIPDAVKITEKAMSRASEMILDGFKLNTDAEIIRFPERYSDERGEEMWCKIIDLLPA